MKEYFARVSVDFMNGTNISDTYTIEAMNETEAYHEAISTAFLLECTENSGLINVLWIREK